MAAVLALLGFVLCAAFFVDDPDGHRPSAVASRRSKKNAPEKKHKPLDRIAATEPPVLTLAKKETLLWATNGLA